MSTRRIKKKKKSRPLRQRFADGRRNRLDVRDTCPRAAGQGRPGRGLTHLNRRGEAHMVDVGAKAVTVREAV
ncbi:MAG: hypothetical protein AABY62_11055, partial [Pseudomonadota bacterium]